jgi:hypothetical protein
MITWRAGGASGSKRGASVAIFQTIWTSTKKILRGAAMNPQSTGDARHKMSICGTEHFGAPRPFR